MCYQCGRPFTPNPRVAARQVTCGDTECKRRNHAESCRRWRQKNHAASSHHYSDVIAPFRAQHQTYQREWRLVRSLRKIRDSIDPVLRAVDGPLDRLILRGERVLTARAQERTGRPPRRRDLFPDVLAVAQRLSRAVKELKSLARRLTELDACSNGPWHDGVGDRTRHSTSTRGTRARGLFRERN